MLVLVSEEEEQPDLTDVLLEDLDRRVGLDKRLDDLLGEVVHEYDECAREFFFLGPTLVPVQVARERGVALRSIYLELKRV